MKQTETNDESKFKITHIIGWHKKSTPNKDQN